MKEPIRIEHELLIFTRTRKSLPKISILAYAKMTISSEDDFVKIPVKFLLDVFYELIDWDFYYLVTLIAPSDKCQIDNNQIHTRKCT